MKLKLFITVLTSGTLLFSGCGGKEETTDESTEEATTEETEEMAEPVEEKKILTPMNAAEFEPIDAKLLLNTWKAWEGKKVQVTGYLDLFFDKGSLSFQTAKLNAEPGDKVTLVSVDLTEKDTAEYTRNIPVTIEGTLKGLGGFSSSGYYVSIADGKIISGEAEIPSEADLNPENLGSPVSAKALYDNYIGWVGKEITVTGNANGVTTSTTSYGVTIRIDLCNPDSYSDKYCGVRVVDSTHAQSTKDDPNETRTFRGKFIGDCFSQVCIEEAVEVK